MGESVGTTLSTIHHGCRQSLPLLVESMFTKLSTHWFVFLPITFCGFRLSVWKVQEHSYVPQGRDDVRD